MVPSVTVFLVNVSWAAYSAAEAAIVEDVHSLVAFPIRFGRRMAVIHSDNRISVHSVWKTCAVWTFSPTFWRPALPLWKLKDEWNNLDILLLLPECIVNIWTSFLAVTWLIRLMTATGSIFWIYLAVEVPVRVIINSIMVHLWWPLQTRKRQTEFRKIFLEKKNPFPVRWFFIRNVRLFWNFHAMIYM